MRRLWRQYRLLSIAFLLAGALTAFFAVRLVASWIYWNDPGVTLWWPQYLERVPMQTLFL